MDEHFLELNNIDRAWVETRHYATEDGAGQFDVHVAVCSCGRRLEGKDGAEISKLFSEHVDAQ